jgi:hypothetical protein
MKISQANEWLSRLEEQIEHDLNPSGEDCPFCGGEGATFDCVDGFCLNAESGCDGCAQPCAECRRHEINIRRAVRVEVLRALDVELGRAFLRRFRNWRGPDLEDAKVLANLHAGRAASTDFTTDERADSACWVEGLL